VTSFKLTDGKAIHGGKAGDQADDSSLILQAVQSALSLAVPIPFAFDPYFQMKTTLQDYEAKDGWLNVYESYEGMSSL